MVFFSTFFSERPPSADVHAHLQSYEGISSVSSGASSHNSSGSWNSLSIIKFMSVLVKNQCLFYCICTVSAGYLRHLAIIPAEPNVVPSQVVSNLEEFFLAILVLSPLLMSGDNSNCCNYKIQC